jgi:hypothetical protein
LLLAVACAATARCADPLAFPLDEPPWAAQLAGIDAQWNISLKTAGKIRVVRAGDVAYWGRYRDVEGGPQILLTDRSVIRSDVLQLDERQLILGDATGLGRGQWDESALPLAAVAAILWQPPADTLERDKLLTALLRENDADDRLLLFGGESLSGTLVAAPLAGRFAPENVKPGSEVFELARRGQPQPLKIPSARVIAVRLAGSSPPQRPAGEMSGWLGLRDGSLVRAAQVSVKGDVVTVHLAAGGQILTTLAGRKDAALKFWDEVTYLEPVGPRVKWLSDLPALAFRHIPFLSAERPLGRDQNVLGGRLRAGGAVCRKGLGMPSASRLAVDVTGYRRFEAEIAIDDAAELQGSVTVKVLLEASPGQWKPADESPPIRGGDLPRQIAVDLAGASHLALLVDFADRGDTCDWADWLQARLVK